MRVTYKMVKLAEGHLCANIFTHRDESDGNHSERGEGCLGFGFFLCILFLLFGVFLCHSDVVVAMMEHGLDFKNVPCSGKRASFD